MLSDPPARAGANGKARAWARAAVRLFPQVALVLHIALSLESYATAQVAPLLSRFSDDAFYYYRIAHNAARIGLFTFDGQTPTNGFHPLWMAILVPVYRFGVDQITALRVIGALSTLLFGATVSLGLRYVGARHSSLAYYMVAALSLRYMTELAGTGMEISLLLFMMIVVLNAFGRMPPWSGSDVSDGRLLLLGLGLALVELARSDAVLFAGVVLAMVWAAGRGAEGAGRRLRKLLLLGAPPVLAAAAYAGVNWMRFGNPMPVSGQVKAMQGIGLNVRMLEQLVRFRSGGELFGTWGVFSGMLVLSLVFVAHRAALAFRQRDAAVWATPAFAVGAFFLIFVAYYLLRTSWVLWEWYAYPAILAAIYLLPEAIEGVESRLNRSNGFRNLLRAISAVVVVLFAVEIGVIALRWGYWKNNLFEGAIPYENYKIATDMNGLDGSARIAMGDRAGSFAYFYPGEVVQLEGLMDDGRVLQAVREDALESYLSDRGVDYLIFYGDAPETYARWTLLVPLPVLSTGPRAGIEVCREREILRRETASGTIMVWHWPSCQGGS